MNEILSNPTYQRIAGTLAAIACFIAAAKLPQVSIYLMPAGVGLLAWMHGTKPGDAPKEQ